MNDKPTCASCRWWIDQWDEPAEFIGYCHRNAPRASPSWPQTNAKSTCGEHKSRPVPRACVLHPDVRVYDDHLYCGYSLCGPCWAELDPTDTNTERFDAREYAFRQKVEAALRSRKKATDAAP